MIYKNMKRVHVGDCGVDSGQILLCDPCYIKDGFDNEPEFRKVDKPQLTYDGCCDASSYENDKAGQLYFEGQMPDEPGHAGAGVCVSSGYGDGFYPVYADFNDEGRVVKVTIEFDNNLFS